MNHITHIDIDTNALRHNFYRIRELAPHSKIMAMLKADAYGHDMEVVAKALPEADAFGVAAMEEALRLRRAGIHQKIVLMTGFLFRQDVQIASQENIDLVIHGLWQIDILEQAYVSKPLQVWLKIDTGMHRLGVPLSDARQAWERLRHCSNVMQPPRVMTHFASADDLEGTVTLQQMQHFFEVTREMVTEKSLANSAAILAWPSSHQQWVRPGYMLYGGSPFKGQSAEKFNLKPVMTLRSSLLAIRQCKKGESIGYGHIWTAHEDTAVGVINAGYGDGYPRHAPAGTPVLLNNKRVPIIGRVSMDSLFVDLRTQPNARIGDEAILWGNGLPIEDVADSADTIGYELMCHAKSRDK